MKKERRFKGTKVYEDVSEYQYDVEIQRVPGFSLKNLQEGIILLLVVFVFLTLYFSPYYHESVSVHNVNGVGLTEQDKQVVLNWKEEVVPDYKEISNNAFINFAIVLFIIFTVFMTTFVIRSLFYFIIDIFRVDGINNRLEEYTFRRYRFSKSGRLLIYKNDSGCFDKDLFKSDLIALIIVTFLIVALATTGFLVEVM